MSVSTVAVQGNLLPSQNIFSEVQSIHDTGVYYGGSEQEPNISPCAVAEVRVASPTHEWALDSQHVHCLHNVTRSHCRSEQRSK